MASAAEAGVCRKDARKTSYVFTTCRYAVVTVVSYMGKHDDHDDTVLLTLC